MKIDEETLKFLRDEARDEENDALEAMADRALRGEGDALEAMEAELRARVGTAHRAHCERGHL